VNAPPLVSALGFCSVCSIVRENDGDGRLISDCICSAKLRHKAECGYVAAVSCPVSVRSCDRHQLDACEECDCTCGADKAIQGRAGVR
jgi:hypothetical protein